MSEGTGAKPHGSLATRARNVAKNAMERLHGVYRPEHAMWAILFVATVCVVVASSVEVDRRRRLGIPVFPGTTLLQYGYRHPEALVLCSLTLLPAVIGMAYNIVSADATLARAGTRVWSASLVGMLNFGAFWLFDLGGRGWPQGIVFSLLRLSVALANAEAAGGFTRSHVVVALVYVGVPLCFVPFNSFIVQKAVQGGAPLPSFSAGTYSTMLYPEALSSSEHAGLVIVSYFHILLITACLYASINEVVRRPGLTDRARRGMRVLQAAVVLLSASRIVAYPLLKLRARDDATHDIMMLEVAIILLVLVIYLPLMLVILTLCDLDVRARESALAESQREIEVAHHVAEARKRMMRWVCHEARVPLNTIRLGLDELLQDNSRFADIHELQDTLPQMSQACRAITHILDDVLRIAQIDAGELRFVLEPVQPNRLLQSVLHGLGAKAEAAGRRIDVDIEPTMYDAAGAPVTVLADPNRIMQVLSTVLSNGLRFSRTRVKLTCRLLYDDRQESSVERGLSRHSGMRAALTRWVSRLPPPEAGEKHVEQVVVTMRDTDAAMTSPPHRSLPSQQVTPPDLPARPTSESIALPDTSRVSSTRRASSRAHIVEAAEAQEGSALSATGLPYLIQSGTATADSGMDGLPTSAIEPPSPSVSLPFAPAAATMYDVKVPTDEWMDTAQHATLVFECEDDGMGIGEEEQALLFQPFVQLNAGIGQKGRATGLGLSICHEIVTRHGGRISVRSQTSKFASFSVEIPVKLLQRTSTHRQWRRQPPRAPYNDRHESSIMNMPIYSVVPAIRTQGSARRLQDDIVAIDVTDHHDRDITDDAAAAMPNYLCTPIAPNPRVDAAVLSSGTSLMYSAVDAPPAITAPTPLAPSRRLPPVVETPQPALPEHDISPGAVRVLRFLLVDDVESNRKLLKTALKRRFPSSNLRMCENGREAIDLVRVDPSAFDVICLDKEMPVCDGYEAAIGIRAAGYSGLLVGVTGNCFGPDRDEFLSKGLDDIVFKPVDADALASLIRRRLALPEPPDSVCRMMSADGSIAASDCDHDVRSVSTVPQSPLRRGAAPASTSLATTRTAADINVDLTSQ